MAPDLLKNRMGLVLKTEIFDENDSIIKVSDNTYNNITYAPTIYNARNGSDYHVLDNHLMQVTSTTETHNMWDPSTNALTATTVTYNYGYDNHNNRRFMSWLDSKGDTYKQYSYYNYDYLGKYGYVEALDTMDKRKMVAQLSTETWKMTSGDSVMIGYSLTCPKYNVTTGAVQFPASFVAAMDAPLTSSQVFPSSGPGVLDFGAALNYSSNSSFGTNLIKRSVSTLFDDHNNVLETQLSDQGVYSSNIWDTHTGEKLAEVANACYKDIAYTSFESKYAASGTSYTKGNWDFDTTYIYHTPGITGNYAFAIAPANTTITSKPLRKKSYVLSFWVSSYSSGPLVNLVDLSAGTHSVNYTPFTNVVNGWYLYTAVIAPDSGWKVRISGNNGAYYIDEVRLYPLNSSMTSYTYNPLCGLQDKDDGANYINYYEYDDYNHLKIVRDLRKNIIQQIETGYNKADIVVPTGTGFYNGGNTSPY